MKTVFLDRASLDMGDIDFTALDRCAPGCEYYASSEASQVSGRIRDANIVITNKVELDRELLSAAPGLKLICVTATGTDNVDLRAAQEIGIVVSNARGYATASVVEHVFTLLTSLMRQLPDYGRAAVDGRWQRSRQFCYLDKPIMELCGKTLGIIGYGELGQAVAKMARAFQMQVLIAQRPGSQQVMEGRVALDAMLPRIDVLSLHCPLADNTHGLIDQACFERLPDHALLINTARGGIVKEDDLLHALRSGQIAAAGIDVLNEEPPANGNPLLNSALPNLLVTPHVAWASREARQRLLGELVENIEAFRAGRVRHQVRA